MVFKSEDSNLNHKIWYLNLFKKNRIHSMQGSTAPTRHEVTRKRITKKLKHTGNLIGKKKQLKGVC